MRISISSQKLVKFLRLAAFVIVLAMFAVAAAAPEYIGTIGH
jgi:hypothetical protein